MRRKRQREEEESDDEFGDFVVDDEEGDWRNALKSVTGYDPSRCATHDPLHSTQDGMLLVPLNPQ